MKRIMVMAAMLATGACNRAPEAPGALNTSTPGEERDAFRAQANETNAAALNSATPNTLEPGDVVNSTTEVGGGAALETAPTTPR